MTKAELHLHLEGSVYPQTLIELGAEPAEVEGRYKFTDFAGFLECFKFVSCQLRGPEEYALVTRRLLDDLDREQVSYAEITLAAGVVLWRQQDFAGIWQAVREASRGANVRWILDGIRHFGDEHVRQVAELAAERAGEGVVALGIGGDESRGPAEWFGETYAWARGQGLHLVAHAGETCGPESVWAALAIGAERIGHGFRAAEDNELVVRLRESRIPLEICLTSNLRTGAVARLEEHPAKQLADAGVRICLNTDDPGIFGVTLSHEYELAARLGLDVDRLAEESFGCTFCDNPCS